MEATELITVGRRGLAAGDWSAARTAFEQVPAAGETAEALDGLGEALWWQNEPDTAIELRQRPYAESVRRGEAACVGAGRDAVLTDREEEVLELAAAGLTNRQIAGRLFLSVKTVERHVSRVLAKLGLQTRAEAAAAYVRRKVDGAAAQPVPAPNRSQRL